MKRAYFECVWLSFLASVLLLLQMSIQVTGIAESMCFSTGFTVIGTKTSPYHTAETDIGSNRLTPFKQGKWTSAFWAVNLNPNQNADPSFKVTISYLSQNGIPMSGWLHINVERSVHFFHTAIWTVNERNEAYGQFVHEIDRNDMDNLDNKETYAFIPCSAAPSNSDTIPSTFVYTALKMSYSITSPKTFEHSTIPLIGNLQKTSKLSIVWRAPSQTFCNRPEKFRFIIVATGKAENEVDIWGTNWLAEPNPFKNMLDAAKMGPILYNSDWIKPIFYGTPENYVRKEAKLEIGKDIFQFSTGNWVVKTSSSPTLSQDRDWKFKGLYDSKSNDYPFQPSIVRRATCRRLILQTPNGAATTKQVEMGRCEEPIDPKTTGQTFVKSTHEAKLMCVDESSTLWANEFMYTYEEYLKSLEKRLTGDCVCLVGGSHPGVNPRTFKEDEPQTEKGGKDVNARTATESPDDKDSDRYISASCQLISSLSKADQSKAGICLLGNPGMLVYGVRQWHAFTALLATLLVTPMTMFLARYAKGEITLIEHRVPYRTWYSAHILLIAPTMWFYASGAIALRRQTVVVGRSMTAAGKMHRIMGYTVYALIPTHFLTGFFRPRNKFARWVAIFVHWAIGIIQHILELMLCIFSSRIPGSPTSSRSYLSPKFGKLESSISSNLVLAWVIFNVIFHIVVNIKIKYDDWKSGMWKRKIFPIIIPLFSEQRIEDIEIGEKQRHWFIIGSACFYGMISSIVFTVSVVALYQSLSPFIYHGLGPMTCTHLANGRIKTSGIGC